MTNNSDQLDHDIQRLQAEYEMTVSPALKAERRLALEKLRDMRDHPENYEAFVPKSFLKPILTCKACCCSIIGDPKYRVLKYDESLQAYEDIPLCSADCYRDFLSCELDDFRREDFK